MLCIILLAGAWLLSPGFTKSFKTAYQNKILLLLVSFYTFHVLSVFYSTNLNYAFFDLQVKLSFIFFPLILSAFVFSEEQIRRFKLFFVVGTLFGSLLCMGYVVNSYMQTNDIANTFFYTNYSRFLHPAYFTIYLNIAQLFLLEAFFTPPGKSKLYRAGLFITMLILWISITLLSSRTAYVVSIATVFAYLVVLFIQRKIQKKYLIFPLLLIVTVAAMQWVSVGFYNRYTQINEAIQSTPQESQTTPLHTEKNSTTTHYLIWQNVLGLVKQHPVFGVGIGDVHDELNKEYLKNNFQYGIEKDFNPHNQFLHTMVSLGSIGLILLLGLFILPVYITWENKEWVYLFFLAVVFLNCMTESVLERQAGIIFFAFFYSLFTMRNQQRV